MCSTSDKCHYLIERIKKEGFLNYFFDNYLTTDLFLAIDKLREITITNPIQYWFIRDNEIYFNLTNDFSWNITSELPNYETLTMESEKILEYISINGFFEYFIKECCIPLQYKNIQSYIYLTKDEYKNAWFIDRNKHIIYFKFRHVYGEGAVKKTYLGWNITHNKPCVVYQINCPISNIEQKRSLNEKRIAEIEKSPYLLTIHYSTSNKILKKVYMIADFCRYNVRQMIIENFNWTNEDYKLFTQHILSGLKVLHDMKIIHRDVKPSNIVYDDTKNIYKLIDFGVATKFTSTQNLDKIETLNNFDNSLSLIGTPGYISPEMFKSLYSLKKIDYNFSVDIFSFGITLLEMYTKKRAYQMDIYNLPTIIKYDLELNESIFHEIVDKDTDFLKKLSKRLDEIINNKKFESLKNEVQEKIDILKQLKTCDFDEKELFISELIDKNKSIYNYCKKYTEKLHIQDLDDNTIEEYEFIYKMKTLKLFYKKLDHFLRQEIDILLNDYQIYPILFMISSYEYPLLLNEIDDDLLMDFLKQCLNKNPQYRMNIDELLNHPWIIHSSDQSLKSNI
jgi:serine/threonine protein kinase